MSRITNYLEEDLDLEALMNSVKCKIITTISTGLIALLQRTKRTGEKQLGEIRA